MGKRGILKCLLGLLLAMSMGCGSKDPPAAAPPSGQTPANIKPQKPFETIKPH
jgi:hypothetical protein